ncbi:hypothetical protein FN846DRAFT_1022356 [Sphaerosporella brunnea]|uniref:Uncharacterized protein n=1 Tax=Sphaerosporella brunnea TaxID=1250544 RepID=A0A5J5EUQ9_9PEZI|nr:hypothetical protein FN846DRAFT_1022356 [Sphaerosporella brunnea]
MSLMKEQPPGLSQIVIDNNGEGLIYLSDRVYKVSISKVSEASPILRDLFSGQTAIQLAPPDDPVAVERLLRIFHEHSVKFSDTTPLLIARLALLCLKWKCIGNPLGYYPEAWIALLEKNLNLQDGYEPWVLWLAIAKAFGRKDITLSILNKHALSIWKCLGHDELESLRSFVPFEIGETFQITRESALDFICTSARMLLETTKAFDLCKAFDKCAEKRQECSSILLGSLLHTLKRPVNPVFSYMPLMELLGKEQLGKGVIGLQEHPKCTAEIRETHHKFLQKIFRTLETFDTKIKDLIDSQQTQATKFQIPILPRGSNENSISPSSGRNFVEPVTAPQIFSKDHDLWPFDHQAQPSAAWSMSQKDLGLDIDHFRLIFGVPERLSPEVASKAPNIHTVLAERPSQVSIFLPKDSPLTLETLHGTVEAKHLEQDPAASMLGCAAVTPHRSDTQCSPPPVDLSHCDARSPSEKVNPQRTDSPEPSQASEVMFAAPDGTNITGPTVVPIEEQAKFEETFPSTKIGPIERVTGNNAIERDLPVLPTTSIVSIKATSIQEVPTTILEFSMEEDLRQLAIAEPVVEASEKSLAANESSLIASNANGEEFVEASSFQPTSPVEEASLGATITSVALTADELELLHASENAHGIEKNTPASETTEVVTIDETIPTDEIVPTDETTDETSSDEQSRCCSITIDETSFREPLSFSGSFAQTSSPTEEEFNFPMVYCDISQSDSSQQQGSRHRPPVIYWQPVHPYFSEHLYQSNYRLAATIGYQAISDFEEPVTSDMAPVPANFPQAEHPTSSEVFPEDPETSGVQQVPRQSAQDTADEWCPAGSLKEHEHFSNFAAATARNSPSETQMVSTVEPQPIIELAATEQTEVLAEVMRSVEAILEQKENSEVKAPINEFDKAPDASEDRQSVSPPPTRCSTMSTFHVPSWSPAMRMAMATALKDPAKKQLLKYLKTKYCSISSSVLLDTAFRLNWDRDAVEVLLNQWHD